MFLGLLQFNLLIPGAESLKDKRRVVRSVKDRLHREHQVSVAEVRHLENPSIAGMAIAIVNRDGKYLRGVLDTISDKLRSLPDAQLADCSREILHADQLPTAYQDDDGNELWTEDERRGTRPDDESGQQSGPP
ncbi:MAG: DUF503 domain-containing protein [Phycisphaerales bacterium]|jgi:uncharacterized protein YlxP (DUF503 family)